MVGESRYILHPASLDSCLQLMIVAIWAGRTNAMTCGAVPVQADEVAIWKPTEAQISDGSAKAFSWIDPRGVRSFNAHNQLVANNGEVLMEISNMRCSAYEAAVPQRASEPAKPQPYEKMAWKRDVSFLSASEDMEIPSFVQLADFKQPGLKVLAIGSAYGNAILEKVPELDITITEESTELIDTLEQDIMTFKNAKAQQLEFNRDLESQSIKAGSFDLIVASINTPAVLIDLRRALVDGGRAVLEFATSATADTLKSAEFSGIDSMLKVTGKKDAVVATAGNSVINGLINGSINHDMHLVYRKKAPPILTEVQNALEDIHYNVTIAGIEDEWPSCSNVIMLADFESPLLPNITESEFLGLQRILNTANNVLWVSAGGLLAGKHPEFAMAPGLMRSLSSEQASINVITIDFDRDTTSATDIARITSQIAEKQTQKNASLETEYCVSEGKLFISRLISEQRINNTYTVDDANLKLINFDPVAYLVGNMKSGKVIFETDDRVQNALDPEAIEVQVLATGLNREDVLIISGTEFPNEFSHEIGGVVKQVGSATHEFVVGDRVVGFSFDKFATFQRVHQDLLQKIEPKESLTEMTSLPMGYAAAFHGLKTLANLQKDESVLILPGSGLAGTAAIGVVQAMGGYTYVVVNNDSQIQAVKQQFGLSSKQVIAGSETSQLRQAGGHYEVDIIFFAGWVDPSDMPCLKYREKSRK